MLARTQPDVVQPVTITVSIRWAVRSAASGVPANTDGHFLISSESDGSHRRSSTSTHGEPGTI